MPAIDGVVKRVSPPGVVPNSAVVDARGAHKSVIGLGAAGAILPVTARKGPFAYTRIEPTHLGRVNL